MTLVKPVSVLLVEDNQADSELAVEGLETSSAAVSVHVACDGYEALDHLRTTQSASGGLPDLILLDLNLPRLDGLATLAAIKADEALRHIPVLVLTTSKSQNEINRSYELGAAAVVNKPMRLADHRHLMRAFDAFWLRQVRLPGGRL
jgi:CheY-like chemotaxis protein